MSIFEPNPPPAPNLANWTPPNLKVCVVRPGLAALPRYASAAAAGMDLSAALVEPLVLPPGARALVPTGLAIALPHGFEGQVRPRSGLAIKHGVTIVNAPGTIDEDYRGEVSVALINLGKETYTIQPGERIAQLVVAPVLRLAVECVGSVEELGVTQRGAGGFGSTGGFGANSGFGSGGPGGNVGPNGAI